MNFIFSSCRPIFPEPDHPQTLPVWVFQNGTAVNAISVLSAIKKLETVQLKKYWAMETEPHLWDIQFDDDVTVECVKAYDAIEAVQMARIYLIEDAKNPMIVRSAAPARLSRRCDDICHDD